MIAETVSEDLQLNLQRLSPPFTTQTAEAGLGREPGQVSRPSLPASSLRPPALRRLRLLRGREAFCDSPRPNHRRYSSVATWCPGYKPRYAISPYSILHLKTVRKWSSFASAALCALSKKKMIFSLGVREKSNTTRPKSSNIGKGRQRATVGKETVARK